MALRESKPDYDTYFSDPALVKGYYIPTEPLKLTEKQRMVSHDKKLCILIFIF